MMPPKNPPEVWRPVAGFEGIYEVSNHGRVRSLPRLDCAGRHLRGKVLDYSPTRSGAVRVHLHLHGVRYPRYLADLVADAFLPPPPDRGYRVAHMGAIDNDAAWNLCWLTPGEIRARKAPPTQAPGKTCYRAVPVVATDPDTGHEWRFDSMADAERWKPGRVRQAMISYVLAGKINTHAGLLWRRADEEGNPK